MADPRKVLLLAVSAASTLMALPARADDASVCQAEVCPSTTTCGEGFWPSPGQPGICRPGQKATLQLNARGLFIAGSFLTGFSLAHLIPATVLFIVDALRPPERYPVYDYHGNVVYYAKADITWPSPEWMSAVIMMPIGASMLAAGIPMLIAGSLMRKKARQTTDTALSPYLSEEISTSTAILRRLAIAGFTFAGLSILSAVLHWSFVLADEVDQHIEYNMGAFIMTPLWATSFLPSVPLLLTFSFKARRAAGLKGTTPLSAGAWVTYGLAVPAIFVSYLQLVGSAIATMPFIVSIALAMGAAVQAARLTESLPGMASRSKLTIVPLVAPVPGGTVMGVAGAY